MKMKSVQVDSLTVGASYTAALVAGLMTEINFVLLVLCLVAFIADLLSGMGKCIVLEGWESIDGDKFRNGLGKKILTMFFWVAAALVDSLLALLSPGDIGSIVSGMTPVLKGVFVYTLIGEIGSIAQNTMAGTGKVAIGSVILRALRERVLVQPGVEHGESNHTHVVVIDEDQGGEPPGNRKEEAP